MNYSGKWNWPNTWRLSFILIGLFWFFNKIVQWYTFAQILGIIGGTLFIILLVVRFEDVKKFMDSNRSY